MELLRLNTLEIQYIVKSLVRQGRIKEYYMQWNIHCGLAEKQGLVFEKLHYILPSVYQRNLLL